MTMGSVQAGNRGPSTPKPKHVVIRLTGSIVKDHKGNVTFFFITRNTAISDVFP